MLFKPLLEEGAQEDQGHDDHEVPAQAAAPGARAWISSAETGKCGPGELRLPLPPRLSRGLPEPFRPADLPLLIAPGETEAKGAGRVQPLDSLLEQRPCRRTHCREEERQG